MLLMNTPQRGIAVLVMILFALFTMTPDLAAQNSEDIRAQIQKRGIGEKAKVKITLKNNSQVVGYIKEATDETFTLVDFKTKAEQVISYGDVAKVQKTGLSKGAKIAVFVSVGVAAFILVAAAVISHGWNKPWNIHL